ncbi:MAG: AraC family transcriptional regulator [Clostridia bacterium]|jgi:AraC family transcriptional regulator
MDWIKALNQAIEYIEDNLLHQLTCGDIAGHVYISNFHFQRTFNLLTGLSVGEYVRKRRLSLAGQELLKGDEKVLNVALKYGYETPESFSKAFRRFHGITPSYAKKQGSDLKSFSRLVIKINMEGGNIMDYKIVSKESFKVVAKTKLFTEQNSKKGIPEFWTEYYEKGLDNKVCGMMGICAQANGDSEEWKYGIGSEVHDVKGVPKDFEVLEIPAHTWAIFSCIGPMPNAIQEMWRKIYSEWLPQSDYELVNDYDIEFYTSGNNQDKNYQSEIWIPVQTKS